MDTVTPPASDCPSSLTRPAGLVVEFVNLDAVQFVIRFMFMSVYLPTVSWLG